MKYDFCGTNIFEIVSSVAQVFIVLTTAILGIRQTRLMKEQMEREKELEEKNRIEQKMQFKAQMDMLKETEEKKIRPFIEFEHIERKEYDGHMGFDMVLKNVGLGTAFELVPAELYDIKTDSDIVLKRWDYAKHRVLAQNEEIRIPYIQSYGKNDKGFTWGMELKYQDAFDNKYVQFFRLVIHPFYEFADCEGYNIKRL